MIPNKNFKLLFFAVLVPTLLNAQTIGNITPDTYQPFHLDPNYTLEYQGGESGNGVTWDFSDTPFSSFTGMYAFFPASEGDGNENFPDATHAEGNSGNIGGNYNYYDFSNGSWIFVGSYSAFGTFETIKIFDDPWEYFTVPLTPESSGEEAYEHHTEYFGMDWAIIANCTWEADGTGTLIMPNATYSEVIRVRSTCYESESLGSTTIRQNTLIHHFWVKEGLPTLLLYTTHKTSTLIENGETEETYQATAFIELDSETATPEVNTPTFKMYPNPANDILTLSTENGKSIDQITIYDSQGRQVVRIKNIADSETEFTVSQLPQGLYKVVVSCDGNYTQRAFIKQ